MNSLSVNLFQHFQHQFLLNLLLATKDLGNRGHQAFLHQSRFCFPFFFLLNRLAHDVFRATPLNSTTDRNLRSAQNPVKLLSLFSESKIFAQNVACNQIISSQFGVLLLHIFCFLARWPIYSLLTSPKWV